MRREELRAEDRDRGVRVTNALTGGSYRGWLRVSDSGDDFSFATSRRDSRGMFAFLTGDDIQFEESPPAGSETPTAEEYRAAYEAWRTQGQAMHAVLLTIWRALTPDSEHGVFQVPEDVEKAFLDHLAKDRES